MPTIRLLETGSGNLDSWEAALDALSLEVRGRNLPAGESFGQSLAELRRRRGLSQRDLAGMLGTSQPTIIALERSDGGRLPTLEQAARVLGAGLYLSQKGTPRPFFTHAGNSSTGQSWETPQWLLEALYGVFGRFDLDPCSPRRTNPPVRARTHFTAEDDGLSLPWHGCTFANPPYGRQLSAWVRKARSEFEAGHASPVLLLIPARTETNYWHAHVAGKATVYFLRGRLRFSDGGQSAPFPSALAIWGARDETLETLDAALPGAWRAG